MNTSGLEKSVAWKSYKPSATFEASDSSGYSGTKTFEQAIIPAQPGAQAIPPLSFSYFDPGTGKYVTKHTEPIAINVAAADPSKSTALVTAVSESNRDTRTPSPSASALGSSAPQVHASPIASLHPLVLRPWFLVGNVTMLAALAIVTVARRVASRRARDPQRRASRSRRGIRACTRSRKWTSPSERPTRPGSSSPRAISCNSASPPSGASPANEVTATAISERLNGKRRKPPVLLPHSRRSRLLRPPLHGRRAPPMARRGEATTPMHSNPMTDPENPQHPAPENPEKLQPPKEPTSLEILRRRAAARRRHDPTKTAMNRARRSLLIASCTPPASSPRLRCQPPYPPPPPASSHKRNRKPPPATPETSAILAYERAQWLAPNDKAIATQLSATRQEAGVVAPVQSQ